MALAWDALARIVENADIAKINLNLEDQARRNSAAKNGDYFKEYLIDNRHCEC